MVCGVDRRARADNADEMGLTDLAVRIGAGNIPTGDGVLRGAGRDPRQRQLQARAGQPRVRRQGVAPDERRQRPESSHATAVGRTSTG